MWTDAPSRRSSCWARSISKSENRYFITTSTEFRQSPTPMEVENNLQQRKNKPLLNKSAKREEVSQFIDRSIIVQPERPDDRLT